MDLKSVRMLVADGDIAEGVDDSVREQALKVIDKALDRLLKTGDNGGGVVIRPKKEAPLALSVNWIDGESSDGEVVFNLTAGAGVGSPYMTLNVKVDGKSMNEYVDVRDLLTDWVERIVAEMRG